MRRTMSVAAGAAVVVLAGGVMAGANQFYGADDDPQVTVEPVADAAPEPEPEPEPEPVGPRWDNDGVTVHPLDEPTSWEPSPAVEEEPASEPEPAPSVEPAPPSDPDPEPAPAAEPDPAPQPEPEPEPAVEPNPEPAPEREQRTEDGDPDHQDGNQDGVGPSP